MHSGGACNDTSTVTARGTLGGSREAYIFHPTACWHALYEVWMQQCINSPPRPHMLLVKLVSWKPACNQCWLSGLHPVVVMPHVQLIGNIHGDEVGNREVLLHLVHYLAAGYGRIPRVTQLMHHVRVYIMPSMNPDGAEARTRHNANGTDMNRNFPMNDMPYGKHMHGITKTCHVRC